jgi:hypothetical protein
MTAFFNGTYSLRFSSEWLIKRYGTVKNFKETGHLILCQRKTVNGIHSFIV